MTCYMYSSHQSFTTFDLALGFVTSLDSGPDVSATWAMFVHDMKTMCNGQRGQGINDVI